MTHAAPTPVIPCLPSAAPRRAVFFLAISPVSRVTRWKSDGAPRTSNLPCKDKTAITLVGHEDGQFRMLQNVLGRPTKDHLPQPALGVGALHQ
jgi:hypothetical protein